MSTLISKITTAVTVYANVIAERPVPRIHITLDPTPSDIDVVSTCDVTVTLECLGNIVEDSPEVTSSKMWSSRGMNDEDALQSVLKDIHASLQHRRNELRLAQQALDEYLDADPNMSEEHLAAVMAPSPEDLQDEAAQVEIPGEDAVAPKRTVMISAVVHPR